MEKKWRTVIGPKSGLLDMDVKEIWKYRDLCLTFIRKNYITKYKQTVFGPFYMILSPLLTSGIFTVVFGTIAGIATDGIPQFLFYMSGNLVWGFFSGCVFENNNIFGNNAYIMGKVYFPRLVIPLANTITKLLNMLIQCIMFVIFYGIFQLRGFTFHSNAWVAVIPLLLLMIYVLGFGIGLILNKYAYILSLCIYSVISTILFSIIGSIIPFEINWIFYIFSSFTLLCPGIIGLWYIDTGIFSIIIVILCFIFHAILLFVLSCC